MDVAITLYNFECKIAGSSSVPRDQYKIWNAERAQGINSQGLWKLTTPVLEDIFTLQGC